MFTVRRILFVVFTLFMRDAVYFQFIAMNYLNLSMLIYNGYNMPFESGLTIRKKLHGIFKKLETSCQTYCNNGEEYRSFCTEMKNIVKGCDDRVSAKESMLKRKKSFLFVKFDKKIGTCEMCRRCL